MVQAALRPECRCAETVRDSARTPYFIQLTGLGGAPLGVGDARISIREGLDAAALVRLRAPDGSEKPLPPREAAKGS